MLGVSLFISCKNKIQCVCVCEKQNKTKQKNLSIWALAVQIHVVQGSAVYRIQSMWQHSQQKDVLLNCVSVNLHLTVGLRQVGGLDLA